MEAMQIHQRTITMNIIASTGKEDIAIVYIVELESGKLVEASNPCSRPSPARRNGCCWSRPCSAARSAAPCATPGVFTRASPAHAEILSQIDFLVRQRFPDGAIPCKQFKIQFARMGEPALNPAVLEVLERLPDLYQAPGLIPSISTVAPASCGRFLGGC